MNTPETKVSNAPLVSSISESSVIRKPEHDGLVMGFCAKNQIPLTTGMTPCFLPPFMMDICEQHCDGQHENCKERKIIPYDWKPTEDNREQRH